MTRQEWDGNSIDFVYDENNQPLAMKYNNTLYYYILNVQGDVIALADQNGTLIAKYTYDPWGKLLKVTPNGWLEEQNAYYLKVAEANPLRYRGYYYDSETGFYYLQSRYYDPAIGRFINADSYASTDATGLLSTNMFAYCENDPINRSDPTGELAHIFAAAALGVLEQFMTDVIYSMVTGQPLDECFSSVGTYIAAAVGGMMSLVPGGGVMQACAELIITSTVQTSIDIVITPHKYEDSTPYKDTVNNIATSGASKWGDSMTSNVTDNISKSATKRGGFGAKVTNAASGIIKSMGKYIGNALNIFIRVVDERTKR